MKLLYVRLYLDNKLLIKGKGGKKEEKKNTQLEWIENAEKVSKKKKKVCVHIYQTN